MFFYLFDNFQLEIMIASLVGSVFCKVSIIYLFLQTFFNKYSSIGSTYHLGDKEDTFLELIRCFLNS